MPLAGQVSAAAAAAKPFWPSLTPRTSSCRQAACPRRARETRDVRPRVMVDGFWQPRCRVLCRPRAVCRVGALKFLSPWILLPSITGRSVLGVLPHAPASSVGGRGPPRLGVLAGQQRERVPWHHPQPEELGRGGVSRACAPVHNVLLRAPTGKPTSSPERGSLFSFFFFLIFFLFYFPSPPHINFCSQLTGSLPPPAAPLPAAASK